MSSDAAPADFRLSHWLVRPGLNRIDRGDQSCHLEPKAMDLLLSLAARPREVVTKDELIDAVWQGRYIADSALTRIVADLRRALGDDAHSPAYIETIPKRGYRLIAAIERPDRQPTAARQRIVVLPFQNLGPTDDAYFTDGITEEITTRLAVASGLAVISRQSALSCGDTRHTAPEIGKMLGVDYILEGSVRWGHGAEGRTRVRISPQLIRLPEDVHVWASIFDGALDEILEMQIRIAEQILERLDVVLSEPERSLLAADRTASLDAYKAYLRGLSRLRRSDFWSTENMRLMVQAYEQAATLDPGFVAAHAALGSAHAAHFWIGLDRSPERLEQAREAIDRSLELDPDHPMALFALGHYHAARREPAAAVRALRAATRKLPNDSELFRVLGTVYRFQGNFERSIAETERALELSPRDARLATSLGFTYCMLRDHGRANALYELALELEPDQISTYVVKTVNHWLAGDLGGARRSVEAMPAADHPSALSVLWQQELLEGDLEAAIGRLDASPLELVEDYLHLAPKSLLAATTHRLRGDAVAAASTFETARQHLERIIEQRPRDPRAHASLAIALAELGRHGEALRQAARAVELLPLDEDAVGGVVQLENLAMVCLLTGDLDAAIAHLDRLLSIPSLISVELLATDPRWSKIRESEAFEAWLDGRRAGCLDTGHLVDSRRVPEG